MFAFDRPVLFLKATTTKHITVPAYVRHDGVLVPAHTKVVHFDPAKDHAAVLSGAGSHSQKVAHKKLSKLPHWGGLPDDHKLAHILSSATNYQNKQSAAAAVSGWKAAMLAGQTPKPAQQAAFDALPEAKRAELLAAVSPAADVSDTNVADIAQPVDSKDAALAEAIDHLKEDAQQPDLPAEEKAEDAALVEKLEAAVDAPAPSSGAAEPGPIEGSHFTTDVNAAPMIHATSKEGAAGIAATGFKLSNNSMYGKGVYFSSQDMSAGGYGETSLSASLKPHKQLVLDNDTDVPAAFTAVTGLSAGQLGSDKGVQAMLDAGIGSMRFKMDDHIYTVVFDPALIAVSGASPAPSDQNPIKNENPEISGVQQSSPKEGDTKIKNGKTYVLKNGRWRLQVTEQEHAEDKADLADALLSGDSSKASELVGKLHEVENGHEVEPVVAEPVAPPSLAGKPSYDHMAQAMKNPDFAKDATHYASLWLAANPGQEDDLSSSLVDLGLLHVAKDLGIYKNPSQTLDDLKAAHDADSQYIGDALSGKLGHYPGKAAMKVSADLPLLEKVAAIKQLAADMQAAASLSAAFSGWKKKAAQGKNPSPAEWKAFYAQPNEKKVAALADVQKVAGGTGHLTAPAVALSPEKAAAVEAAEVPAGGVSVVSTKKVSDPLEGTHYVVSLSNGESVKIGKLTSAESMGLPGWHNLDAPDGQSSYLADTKDGAVAALLEKKAPAPAAADPFPTFADHAKADEAAAQSDPGPQEGDTKQGADGMLVLKDGHWVKVGGDQPSGTTTTLNHTTDGHNKFWSVTVDGGTVTTAYGKIGTKGSTSSKAFASPQAAAAHAAKLVQQKTGKGYYPVSSAAPAAAPKVTAAVENTASWHQIGPQKGSNPGGLFQSGDGSKWYVKSLSAEHVKNEILAAKLYEAAGIAVPQLKQVMHGGKPALASKWVDGLSKPSAVDLASNAGATSGFAADAWLANWDAVGMEFDNLLTAGGGQAVRIDVGGSLLFRAQGEPKGADFGDSVQETKTLLNAKKNPNTAAVFGSMSKEDMEASVAKVLAVSDSVIADLCAKHGPGTAADRAALAAKLVARKADLAKQFPGAAKAQKLAKFKPDELSAPPNFLNWGGTGKAGPSSKPFINQGNHDASQAIWQAAKTGDPDAIKSLTAPLFNKDTGEVTGRVPVLEHPSQWVKGFAQQMLNEIDYQLNPPKKFRFDGGHPLKALDDAYPVAKPGTGGACQKLGEFIVLGSPGTVAVTPEVLPEKITHKSGKLTKQTYSKAAQAAIAKLPDTQKQAIKAYTGYSYGEMNQSLWSGNPKGEAKAAAEGLHTVGHDIAPGTVLSRKLSLHGQDLEQLKKAVGKVLQEPAIMSTSIRPSCWSGNCHFKLNVGPGVKGLYVGYGSLPDGKALSKNAPEDEIVLPPNTRLLVQSVKASNGGDEDGFGDGPKYIVEVLVLPTKE